MKQFFTLAFLLFMFFANAGNTPITLSGFNADVVANGVGAATASTTHDVDSANYAFISSDYQLTGTSALPTSFLPVSGLINSFATTGLSFQLAPYSGLNSLRLQTTSSGTLTFGTPTAATIIYVLGFSGSGSSTATITVKFSDNSTQVFTNVNFNDWYNGSGYAITNVGRVTRTTGVTDLAGTTGPRLYQVPLALNSSNFSKQIVSVTVARTGGSAGNSILNVMAITTSDATFPGGGYTINNGQPTAGSNYASFTEAVTALSSGAITGAVTFTVAPGSGPYNEKISINTVIGASSTNRVTFNCNGVTMAYNTSDANNRSAIILNGAKFITIDSLNVDVSAGTYGWGIVLTGAADSNIIRKCTILTSTTATSSNYIGIVLNGSATTTSTSGNNANGNLIEKNTIKGGYYGMFVYGNSTATAYNTNNIIRNNIIQDFYYYAAYLYYQTNLTLSGNDFSRPTRTSVGAGYVIYCVSSNNVLLEKNKIHNLYDAIPTSSTANYLIYFSCSGLSATQPNRVENNLMYNINSATGSIYAIYSLAYNYNNFYHNTIVLDNASSTAGVAYGMYVYGTGVNVKNNIIHITRGGTGAKYCLYYSTTGVASSNNNVLYMNAPAGTNAVGYQSAAYTTLANWQAFNSGIYDQQSQGVDAGFTNAGIGDYKPSNASINDIGATGLGVITDITGATRGGNPDPGAYEFSLGACSNPPTPGVTTILVSNVCSGANFTLDLIGNSIGSNQTYTWQRSTTSTGTYTNVAAAQTSPLLTTTQMASYYYRCAVQCSGGTIVYSNAVQVTSPALVAGTNYTINNGQPTAGNNFANFSEAVNFFKCGISGAVTFTVAPGSGPYAEQVTIPQVFGASNTNKITFICNGATLAYNTSDANNRTAIILNGADNIVIDSLNIDVSAGTYGWGILLTNQADSNIVRNCTINANITATTTNYSGIVISGSTTATTTSGNNGNANLFLNNIVNGGYYGITAYGNSTVLNKGNVCTGNLVKDFYYYGIYYYAQDSLTISKNDISRPTRSSATLTTAYGLYTSTSTNLLVEKNRIHNLFDGGTTSASTAYCLYIASSGVSPTQPNRVENNMVYNLNNGAGSIYGIYSLSYNNVNYYHNNIVLDDISATAGTTYGMYVYGTGVNVKNNIIHITRGGTGIKYCLYYSTTGVTTSNYNNLYMNASAGTNAVGYYNAAYTTLANWQAANSLVYDQQSVGLDPVYTNPTAGDFTPTASVANNLGTPVGVTTDINNITRSLVTPDIGAYEFSTLTAGLNFGAEALITPTNSITGCYTNSESVTVKIRNSNSITHNFVTNPVTVTVNVTGAATQTLTKTINTGTLMSDSSLNVVFSPTLDMSIAGTYNFAANTTLAGDVNSSNDAMLPVTRTKNTLSAGTAAASPTNFCGNGGTLPTLSVTGHTGYTSLQWQVSNTSGSGYTSISNATISPYTTTTAITQNKYYVLTATCGSNTINSTESAVLYVNPTITSTTPGTRCGTGVVNISAVPSAGATISWFTTPTGGNSIATGNTFITPSISTSTTYYATAGNGQGIAPLGLANAISTTGNTGYTDVGLAFDAIAPFSLQSVAIYPIGTAGSASVTIALKNAAGTILQTYTGNVNTAAAPGVKTVVTLNFTVPAGTGHRLVMNGATGLTSLIREITTGFTYPYTLPGVASITSAYTGGVSSSYYYYFYDWQVSTGCESVRTPVLATVDNSPGCVTVPVTLSSFSGEKIGATNKLSWTTASEINNDGFELQRSADGINFSKLAYVASKAFNGTSAQPINYSFSDLKILSGNNYYRLKQIDKDGRSTYSTIVLLKGNKINTLIISSVYPNPVVNKLNVVIVAPTNDLVTLVMTDVRGKVILQKQVNITIGDNLQVLNLDNIAKGTYFLKLICSNGCETSIEKVIK